mgnify:CR=1 FL=1
MTMNRIINNADLVVEDMLKGWLVAHADTVVATDNSRVVKRARAPEAGKVGVVTGGGSGHEPAFLGYVGDGMVDAVAIGEIFSSPTAKSFLDAMRAANGGAGVACLYGNYAGDNMNVKMAMSMAEREGITVKTVVANDDVPSAPKGDEAKRRGVAGEILMWKVGAAKAAMGGSLDEVIAAAQKAIDNTRSIGIGLSMDAFAVSICKGLALQRVSWKECCIAGAWFGGFQALMPLLGYLLGTQFERFVTSVDHWIAFVLLGIIGGNMIREAFGEEEENSRETAQFDWRHMLPLAVATSIDALAVGVTFAFLQVKIVPAISFIGATTFILSAIGIRTGNIFGAKYKSKAELVGGIVLILMGVKILLEHLGVLDMIFG